MSTLYVEDIQESSCLKKEICESCMEELKGIFTDDQLKRFEESFYKATNNVALERREGKL